MNAAAKARDEALRRVDEHAKETWKYFARRVVVTLAYEKSEFTADDVWEGLSSFEWARTHEPRALGAVMKSLQREGVIEPTERFVPSRRVLKHAGPTRVWRSCVYEAKLFQLKEGK